MKQLPHRLAEAVEHDVLYVGQTQLLCVFALIKHALNIVALAVELGFFNVENALERAHLLAQKIKHHGNKCKYEQNGVDGQRKP